MDDSLGKITRPHHYQHKGFETIDVIEAWTEHLDADDAYCIGNAIKYISRWHSKNGYADLLKVLWYVSRTLSKVDMGNEAVEVVQSSVRRNNGKPSSNDQTTDQPARGINFQDQ